MSDHNFDAPETWEHENGFYTYTSPSRIGKLLAHYELYKTIIGIPGTVIEAGVYKGSESDSFLHF